MQQSFLSYLSKGVQCSVQNCRNAFGDGDVTGALEILCGRTGSCSAEEHGKLLLCYRLIGIMAAGTTGAHGAKQRFRIVRCLDCLDIVTGKGRIGNSSYRTDGNTVTAADAVPRGS